MRHGQKTAKLQRNASHRRALLANLAVSLIENGRITTTLAKAKAIRPYVEKLITLAKRGDIHARRQVTGTIHKPAAVKQLFADIAPLCEKRTGGYCRIIKLGQRMTDSAPIAMIEIIDVQAAKQAAAEAAAATPATTTA